MPPVTPAPNAQDAASEPATLTDELIESISKIPAEDRTMPEDQFLRAVELERTKAGLQKQITANRNFLRMMDVSEALSDDLSEWLEVFYPTKEKDAKRDKDEVTVTRKNHEAAAKTRK